MRNLLIVPMLASLALAAEPADACGPYVSKPRLMQLTTHFTDGGLRSFAITNEPAPANLAWTRLAPSTYDYASIAEASDPERALDLTLVGPDGTQLVSSRRRVFLSQTFTKSTPSVAMEITVPRGQFAIALAGKHADATWNAGRQVRVGNRYDVAWVNTQGIEPMMASLVSASKIDGTDLEAITVLPKTGEQITFVRRGTQVARQFEGTLLGLLGVDGERFVVARTSDQTVHTVWL